MVAKRLDFAAGACDLTLRETGVVASGSHTKMRKFGFLAPGLAYLAMVIAFSDLFPAGAQTAVSGAPMPQGDIPGWRQVFADDFRTNVALGSFPGQVSDKWYVYPDGWRGSFTNGVYMASRVVSVHNGLLDFHLHTEDGKGVTAVVLPIIPEGSGPAHGHLYGRYAIRFRADPLSCYKTAWLLWPDSEKWPRDGEIDFPEGDLDGTIAAFVHHEDAVVGPDADGFYTKAHYTSWHTAVIEWEAKSVSFYLDDQLIGKSTTRIPNTPMHWGLQTETSSPTCTFVGHPDGHIYVAWVVAYVKK